MNVLLLQKICGSAELTVNYCYVLMLVKTFLLKYIFSIGYTRRYRIYTSVFYSRQFSVYFIFIF